MAWGVRMAEHEIELGRAKVFSDRSFPVWSLGHYLTSTESHYLKLVQIRQIVELIDDGAMDAQFGVAAASAELYPEEGMPVRDPFQLTILAEKGGSADQFWSEFARLRR